jgi:hypothetical protein
MLDMGHRAHGFVSDLRSTMTEDHPSDQVVQDRVRSKLGRFVSHPGAIRVTVNNGRVTLEGPILANELDRLIGAVRAVRGVRSVEDQLDVREGSGRLPSLQGGTYPPDARRYAAYLNWNPATQVAVGAAGGLLVAYGLSRRVPTACALGVAGLSLLALAVSQPAAGRSATPSMRTQRVPRGNGRHQTRRSRFN